MEFSSNELLRLASNKYSWNAEIENKTADDEKKRRKTCIRCFIDGINNVIEMCNKLSANPVTNPLNGKLVKTQTLTIVYIAF